jgi:hypothetical protein
MSEPEIRAALTGERIRQMIAAYRGAFGDVPLRVVWASDVRRAVIDEEMDRRRDDYTAMQMDGDFSPTLSPVTFETRRDLPPGTVYCEALLPKPEETR